jgi:hypothetical protein
VTWNSCVCGSLACRGHHPTLQHRPTGTSCSRFRLVFLKRKRVSLLVCSWLPLSFLISFHPCFYIVHFGEVRICQCHRWSRLGCRRWRMSQCWRLFRKMLRASSVRSSSLGVRTYGSASGRSFTSCLMCQLMVRGGWWFLRQSVGSSSRNFPLAG